MNCLCELFNNEIIWLVIIALLIIFSVCGNNYGCGCTHGYNNGNCGC
ncbi:MAG: hypothetical protein IJ389_04915 [Clostridia bacterium]|nr:hypothetical protein [Clostridia bacterium]